MTTVSLRTNIASTKALRQLDQHTEDLHDAFKRVSTGKRIVDASDDAAGVSISALLDTDRRVYLQGVRNVSDGVSLLSVADGAAETLTDIIIRLSELSTQAANGTLGTTQRSVLDTEAQALVEEYNRVIDTADFNGLQLFGSAAEDTSIQAGYGARGIIDVILGASVTSVVGDGTFQAPLIAAAGGDGDFAYGDVNGDGHVDVIASTYGGAPITVLLGSGTGTFTSNQVLTGAFSTYQQENELELADVNGDLIDDLIQVTSGGLNTDMRTYLGNGDGTFGAPTLTNLGQPVSGIQFEDLNGDGKTDYVFMGVGAADAEMGVAFGDGAGGFGAITYYGGYLDDLTLGDVNGDNITDVVGLEYNSTDTIRVFLGNGNGTFTSGGTYAGLQDAHDLTLADVNNDGALDAVYDSTGTNGFGIQLNNGSGTFGAVTFIPTQDTLEAYSVSVSDINGDGNLDFVGLDASLDLDFYLGNGDGTFVHSPTNISIPTSTYRAKFLDTNEDGVNDIVTGTFGGLRTYLANTTTVTNDTNLTHISGISVATVSDALDAQDSLEEILDTITAVRGTIGSLQSRLESASNVLDTAATNFGEAESRIVDADMAVEAVNLAKSSILENAALAVLAQANTSPAIALKLLS